VPTSYTVSDTALKAAVVGTSLTFTLYSDAGCTQQVQQQVVLVETVAFVSRLKTFLPKNAPKGPKIDEVHETLTGVSATGTLYLRVTGTGITPVGGACQAQATLQPAAPVVKDANGVLVGTSGGFELAGPIGTALRVVDGKVVAFFYQNVPTASFLGNLLFTSPGCVGPAYTGSPDGFPYSFGVPVGTTLYVVSPGDPVVPVTIVSQLLNGSCVPFSSTDSLVQYKTTVVPAFTFPLHIEVP